MKSLKRKNKKKFKKISDKLVVVSARELKQSEIERIKRIFHSEEIIQKIDTDMIGGIKIQKADKVFDGSIKQELMTLKKQIVSGELHI